MGLNVAKEPIPLPTSPLKGEEPCSLPFRGRARVGVGCFWFDSIKFISGTLVNSCSFSQMAMQSYPPYADLSRNFHSADNGLWPHPPYDSFMTKQLLNRVP